MVIFKIKYLSAFEIGRKWRFLLITGWILFITVLSFSGTQVVPVPRASAEGLQLTQGTELYLASVVPGILEDMVYFIGFEMVIALTILLFLEYGLKIDISTGMVLGVVIFSAFIGSIGYNVFVVPGFASAHVPSYGASNPGLFAAFFFGFAQSLVYIFGGIFIPLAHIIHNMIVFQSAQVGLSVGTLSITGGGI